MFNVRGWDFTGNDADIAGNTVVGIACYSLLNLRNMELYLVGGLEHFLFFHILGISSSQLIFIFFTGVGQPPTSWNIKYQKCWQPAGDAPSTRAGKHCHGHGMSRSSLLTGPKIAYVCICLKKVTSGNWWCSAHIYICIYIYRER